MKNLSDRSALEVMDSVREELEAGGGAALTKRDLAWLTPAFIALNEKYFREKDRDAPGLASSAGAPRGD